MSLAIVSNLQKVEIGSASKNPKLHELFDFPCETYDLTYELRFFMNVHTENGIKTTSFWGKITQKVTLFPTENA